MVSSVPVPLAAASAALAATAALAVAHLAAPDVHAARVRQQDDDRAAIAACTANHAYPRSLIAQCMDDYQSMLDALPAGRAATTSERYLASCVQHGAPTAHACRASLDRLER